MYVDELSPPSTQQIDKVKTEFPTLFTDSVSSICDVQFD
jgi:hypothetical protein